MLKPYVSICGVRTQAQAAGLRELFVQQQYTTHVGALGYVTSTDSLRGQHFPQFLTLPELNPLLERSPAINIIHHCSSEPENIAQEIEQVLSYEGIYDQGLCRTVQLNNGLINVKTLETIKHRYADLNIVLSIDKESMSNGNLLPEIENRQHYLTYYLIDPSYGTGTPFDVQQCATIFQQLEEKLPHLVGGFAGGLNSDSVAIVAQEIQKQNILNFSLCVDSGVRGTNGCDLTKVAIYLENVGTALNPA
jgi:hypothetical protein